MQRDILIYFFHYLEASLSEKSVDTALQLITYLQSRLTPDNAIKQLLENNAEFINSLFERHHHNGIALAVLSNMMVRITDEDKMAALHAASKTKNIYYFMLSDANLANLNYDSLHAEAVEIGSKPLMRAVAFKAYVYARGNHEFTDLDEVSYKDDSFPINISNVAIDKLILGEFKAQT